ncbi:hypothetical protein RF11_00577 [Thelohanellus kitauei]|uniref:Uncharacterized protein n=1 Tax=Thelohanellus kitauei TaxID=669202 RepID=A0A0C2JXJ1_THEKT|nr:hypothetical protein RF11_00577 [Thelohanellus kitauei]
MNYHAGSVSLEKYMCFALIWSIKAFRRRQPTKKLPDFLDLPYIHTNCRTMEDDLRSHLGIPTSSQDPTLQSTCPQVMAKIKACFDTHEPEFDPAGVDSSAPTPQQPVPRDPPASG